MNLLSAFKHHLKNKKKALFLCLPVVLGVIIIYLLQMLIISQYQIVDRTYVEPQKIYSSVAAKTRVIDDNTLSSIFSIKSDCERVIPWVSHYTYIETVIDNRIGSKVFTIKQEDMDWLIDKLNLKIKEGRLPKADTNEIILHSVVAKNKNLGIGDRIGGSVQKNEALEGDMVVVGILEGESIVSFDSLEYWMNMNQVVSDDYSTGILIVPKEGKEIEINNFINKIDVQGLDVRTYAIVSLQNKIDRKGIDIILVTINIVVIIIITICMGFISYIHMLQRRSEFGILSAIGYTSQNIFNQVFNEILLINMVGVTLGILMSVLIGLLLNLFIFIPVGLPLLLVKPDYMIEAVCVPLFACIFSLFPIWRIMEDLDPIAIIEGVN
ncbi:MAG: ABC-type transport system, involved in lipoprotein release, permease component [Herbinix sp.]|jgi:putative ABC transport system permease protein|nr:ABC-type transport system, involved in lipoprotein release, permease component [Herbinix sp.]